MKKLLLFLLLSTILPVYAQTIEKAWIRRPIPGMKLTGAYMVINNSTTKDINLVAITGKDAEYYEIHSHEKIDGVMKMRQLEKLKIPAQGQVLLKPKSFHIMLIQILKGKLTSKTNSSELELTFDNKKKITVKAQVRKSN